ncbi:MAG: hypothetical protein ACI9YO_002948 [Gammaproteobacteria bacterium]|jgi:hypothetical protein
MSYNPNLGGEGVSILVKTLPPTVTEIGLVKCDVGDKGGEAIITWASNAPKLHWLCIEKNSFSKTIKTRFMMLSKKRSSLLIVI